MRLVLVLTLVLPVAAAEDPAYLEPGKTIAFVGVHVVPMDREVVLKDQVVVVRRGKIVRISPVAEAPPDFGADTVVIEGKGRYLMPGLADMHVHIWHEELLLLFVANGVTTVRNMWGTPLQLGWRTRILEGELIGPRIHTSGAILDGPEPTWGRSTIIETAKEAFKEVARQRTDGYQFIKVYSGLSLPAYEAILKAAEQHKMPVAGHVPRAVGLEGVLTGSQSCIEHLDGYLGWMGGLSDAQIAERVEWTRRAGVANCPTLVVYDKFAQIDDVDRLRKRPEMRFMPPVLRATWDPETDFRLRGLRPGQLRRIKKTNTLRRKMVKALHDGGQTVLLGTDASNPFVLPGYAVHEELRLLVESGLTPFNALRTGTVDAARYLGVAERLGTVQVGRGADLILLDKNPLEDVAHAARPAGVLARHWLSRAEIDRRLEALVASYKRERKRFAGLLPLDRGDLDVAYEVRWNGKIVGEERASLSGGVRMIHVQQVGDAPNKWTRSLRAFLGESGRILSFTVDSKDASGRSYWVKEGRGPLKVIANGKSRDLEMKEGILDLPFFFAKLSLAKLVEDLAVGATRHVVVVELALHGTENLLSIPTNVTRHADAKSKWGKVRVYTLDMKRREGDTKTELRVDPVGIPIRMSTRLELGTVVYERVK